MPLKTKAELGEILDCLVFRDGNKERVVAIQTLHTLQTDAVKECKSEVVEYAAEMRGAHVNTNTSCGQILRKLSATITEQPL